MVRLGKWSTNVTNGEFSTSVLLFSGVSDRKPCLCFSLGLSMFHPRNCPQSSCKRWKGGRLGHGWAQNIMRAGALACELIKIDTWGIYHKQLSQIYTVSVRTLWSSDSTGIDATPDMFWPLEIRWWSSPAAHVSSGYIRPRPTSMAAPKDSLAFVEQGKSLENANTFRK